MLCKVHSYLGNTVRALGNIPQGLSRTPVICRLFRPANCQRSVLRAVPRTNHMSNDQVTQSSTYSTWLLAFRNSASVTAFSVVVVGALFLPKEIARLQANPEMSVRHCLLTSDRRSLVAVMDVNSKEPATALRHHLRLHEFSGDTASSRLLLLIAHPARRSEFHAPCNVQYAS